MATTILHYLIFCRSGPPQFRLDYVAQCFPEAFDRPRRHKIVQDAELLAVHLIAPHMAKSKKRRLASPGRKPAASSTSASKHNRTAVTTQHRAVGRPPSSSRGSARARHHDPAQLQQQHQQQHRSGKAPLPATIPISAGDHVLLIGEGTLPAPHRRPSQT